MTRKLFAIGLMIFASASASLSAQTIKLPDHNPGCENLASLASAAVNSAIMPAAELRFLKSVDDDNIAMTNDMIEYARRFIGTRYRRGGKTPAGFDCSGFTGYVFNQFGFSLGASSRDQFNDGMSVPADDIRPGDLLFFTGRSSRSKTVGHVGIAIDADPTTGAVTFIHASCSGGIRVDRTTDYYYSSRFLGARRVIGTN